MSADSGENVATDENAGAWRLLGVPLGLGFTAAFVAHIIAGAIGGDGRMALLIAAMDWIPWIVIAPAVLWVAFRVQMDLRTIRWALPAHILGCALATILHVLVGYTIGWTALSLGLLDDSLATRAAAQLEPISERLSIVASDVPEAARLRPRYLRVRVVVPIYIALVASARALAHYQRSAARERRAMQAEAKLAEARLTTLQMQLQPHFLFNTLHTISSLVYTRPEAADEMICSLSGLLRGVLETSDQREVSIEKEMQLVETYLGIQQKRFDERLEWRCEIAPGAEAAAVPVFILQPLVENAIVHGINVAEKGGRVAVTASVEGGRLRIEVVNSGPGAKWDSGRVFAGGEGRKGIGLENSRARLAAIYGDDFELSVGPCAEGVCASITIPLRRLTA
jgi:Histidine kinase